MSDSSVPTWKKVLAAVLDFVTVFGLGGYAIAAATGNTTDGGFEMNGTPALVLFAVVIAYFVILPRYGGTLWQRILRTR
jgi:DMSO reductase anchor subunit